MTDVRELKLALATATGNDSAGRLLLATVANADLQVVFVVIFVLSTCCLKRHQFSFIVEVNKTTNAHKKKITV